MSARDTSFGLDAVIYLTIAPLLWAGNFVVARALHGSVEPFVLNYLRWAVAGVVLFPILLSQWRAIRPVVRSYAVELTALAGLGVIGFNWLLYEGLQHTGGSIGGLIFGLTPLLILIVSRTWNGRNLSLLEVSGTLTAFFGVSLVLHQSSALPDIETKFQGPALVFAASFIFALFTVALKRMAIPLAPLPCLSIIVWLALLMMTPFVVSRSTFSSVFDATPMIWAAVTYLGLGASVVAFCAWQSGVSQVGAASSGVFLQLVPFFSVLLSAFFLNEDLSDAKLIGLVVLISGVVIVQIGRWRSNG